MSNQDEAASALANQIRLITLSALGIRTNKTIRQIIESIAARYGVSSGVRTHPLGKVWYTTVGTHLIQAWDSFGPQDMRGVVPTSVVKFLHTTEPTSHQVSLEDLVRLLLNDAEQVIAFANDESTMFVISGNEPYEINPDHLEWRALVPEAPWQVRDINDPDWIRR